MNARHINQQTKLAIVFDQIYHAAQNFLDSTKQRSCFSYLFKQKSKEESIAIGLRDIIEKISSRMTFPQLGYFEETQLLEKLNKYYHESSVMFMHNLHKKRMDKQYHQFFLTLQSCLYDIVKLLFPHINKVDLRHLDDYIEDRDIGALERNDLLTEPLLSENHTSEQASYSSKKKIVSNYFEAGSQRLFYQSTQDFSHNDRPVNDPSYILKI
jgi:hypothetical protein